MQDITLGRWEPQKEHSVPCRTANTALWTVQNRQNSILCRSEPAKQQSRPLRTTKTTLGCPIGWGPWRPFGGPGSGKFWKSSKWLNFDVSRCCGWLYIDFDAKWKISFFKSVIKTQQIVGSSKTNQVVTKAASTKIRQSSISSWIREFSRDFRRWDKKIHFALPAQARVCSPWEKPLPVTSMFWFLQFVVFANWPLRLFSNFWLSLGSHQNLMLRFLIKFWIKFETSDLFWTKNQYHTLSQR